MAFTVNAFAPFNVSSVARIVESDNGNLWFYASEFASLDLWFWVPSTRIFTKVFSLGTGFPFNFILDVATDGAGRQWTSFVIGGGGAADYYEFDDAGVQGANVPGGTRTSMIFASGLIVAGGGLGSFGEFGVYATNPYTSALVWTSGSASLEYNMDCIDPTGQVVGRANNNTLVSINPLTGAVTTLATLAASNSPVATDGTNLWVFDGTHVLVYSTSGSLLHTVTLPSPFTSCVLCFRPDDGLMYATGVTSSGPNMPLYSIDPSGGVSLNNSSLFANGTPNSFYCYSDDSTLYIGIAFGSAGGNLLQLVPSASIVMSP
jgi:hypothetical protein